MSGEITVTRGRTFTEGERLDYAKLNQAGAPIARIDANAITTAEVLLDGSANDPTTEMVSAIAATNLFRNPGLDWNRWLAPDGLTCPVDVRTENALGWSVLPAGAGLVTARSAKVPAYDDGGRVGTSLELQGAVDVTTVEISQVIPSWVSGPFHSTSGQGLSMRVWIYNGTGADFTPDYITTQPATTADGFDNLSSPSVSPSAIVCPNQEWTQVAGTVLFQTRGVILGIRLPSGVLDGPGKVVRFAQWTLAPSTAAGLWVPPQPEAFLNTYGATRPPTVNDDCASGFGVGSQWFTGTEVYQCLNAAEGAALWSQMTLEVRHLVTLANKQASGTAGGTATSGSWQTEPFNTIVEDTGNLSASTAANPVALDNLGAFALPAGLWQFDIEVPRYAVNGFQSRLYNVDGGEEAVYLDTDTAIYGTSGYASATNTGHAVSVMRGRLRLTAASTKLRVETKVAATKATDGMGYAGSMGDEYYATARFTLISA